MKKFVAIFAIVLFLSSCGNSGPEPINYNKDACDFCKMSISESRFAAELITVKGRAYKFDDLQCLLQYDASNKEVAVKNYYVGSFLEDGKLIDATTAFFVKHESMRSPMGGNTAAFTTQKTAADYASKNQVEIMEWKDLAKAAPAEGNSHHGHSH